MNIILTLITLTAFQECIMPIYPVPETPISVTAENYKMTHDSFLFMFPKRDKIIEVGMNGEALGKIEAPAGFQINHFRFIQKLPRLSEKGAIVYAISDRKVEETRLRDRDTGKDFQVITPKSWTIREFLSAGDKYFVNMSNDGLATFRLQEINFLFRDGRYLVRPDGDPFADVDPVYDEWQSNFKHRWVVMTQRGELLAAHQLSERISQFNAEASKRKAESESSPDYDTQLVHWTQPYFKRWASDSPKQWLLSFSQITSLQKFGSDLLISYTGPSKEGYEYNLYLQRLDDEGDQIGQLITVPQGMLMGVDSRELTAYVYIRKNGDEPAKICNIEF